MPTTCFSYLRLGTTLAWLLASGTSCWAQTPTDAPRSNMQSNAAWIRGVAHGFRLVTLEVSPPPDSIDPTERVDLVWTLSSPETTADTTTLLQNLEILRCEPVGVMNHGHPNRARVTVALTPGEAFRLRLADACGTLRMNLSPEAADQEFDSLPAWAVHGVVDRTEAIETKLKECGTTAVILERPTLAPPDRTTAVRLPRTIVIPVEIETGN